MPYISPALKTTLSPPPRKPTHSTQPASPSATPIPPGPAPSTAPSGSAADAPAHAPSVDLGEVLGGRDGDAAVQRAMQAWAGFGALHRPDDDDGRDVGPEDETLEDETLDGEGVAAEARGGKGGGA